MKKIFRNTIALFAVLSFWSCSLQEEKDAYVSPDIFFKNIGQCEAAVRGCYQSLRSIYGKDMMMATKTQPTRE